MQDPLIAAMAAIEKGLSPVLSEAIRWGALAGLGSKYLAVGSPDSVGLVHCGQAAAAIATCHELLFGKLQIKIAGPEPFEQPRGARATSPEEAFACDIVCLPCTVDFDVAWIAEATHLNLRYQTPGPSAGAAMLLRSSAVTVESKLASRTARRHGSLAEVITGQVSGRMADELTLLFHD